MGIARVSRALVGVPPARSSAMQTRIEFGVRAFKAIGSTPMATTETVALPLLRKSFDPFPSCTTLARHESEC
jgi:hypothetical protein